MANQVPRRRILVAVVATLLLPLLTDRILQAVLVPDEYSDAGQIGVVISVALSFAVFSVCLWFTLRLIRNARRSTESRHGRS